MKLSVRGHHQRSKERSVAVVGSGDSDLVNQALVEKLRFGFRTRSTPSARLGAGVCSVVHVDEYIRAELSRMNTDQSFAGQSKLHDITDMWVLTGELT
jgi:hypothetical protein